MAGYSGGIRLLMSERLYRQVQQTAENERTNASAWIRDAIAAKLNGTPAKSADADERLSRIIATYESVTDEGREMMAQWCELMRDSERLRVRQDKGPHSGALS